VVPSSWSALTRAPIVGSRLFADRRATAPPVPRRRRTRSAAKAVVHGKRDDAWPCVSRWATAGTLPGASLRSKMPLSAKLASFGSDRTAAGPMLGEAERARPPASWFGRLVGGRRSAPNRRDVGSLEPVRDWVRVVAVVREATTAAGLFVTTRGARCSGAWAFVPGRASTPSTGAGAAGAVEGSGTDDAGDAGCSAGGTGAEVGAGAVGAAGVSCGAGEVGGAGGGAGAG
jgi:hypothetical protein